MTAVRTISDLDWFVDHVGTAHEASACGKGVRLNVENRTVCTDAVHKAENHHTVVFCFIHYFDSPALWRGRGQKRLLFSTPWRLP